MALILNLETSTRNCSVALAEGGKVLSIIEESSDQYIHSEKLHVFIEKCMADAGRKLDELDAVAVGKGPGSYTGLRIGVSAAKGLCYALGIPLISENGLAIMARDFIQNQSLAEGAEIVPMIDARRMEVYKAHFNAKGVQQSEISATVVETADALETEAPEVHLLGDGANKCKEVLSYNRFFYHNLEFPSASALAIIAEEKYSAKQLEDVAYFEPFYLKDFIAGKPKKLL